MNSMNGLLRQINMNTMRLPLKMDQRQALRMKISQVERNFESNQYFDLMQNLLLLSSQLQKLLQVHPGMKEKISPLLSMVDMFHHQVIDTAKPTPVPEMIPPPEPVPEYPEKQELVARPLKKNLIKNGDFEESTDSLVYWGAVNAEVFTHQSRSMSNLFSGNAVAILGKPLFFENATLSQKITLTGATIYGFSFAISGNPLKAVPAVSVDFFRGSEKISSFSRILTPPGWGFHTFNYQLEAPVMADHALITFSKSGSGEVYVDLVSLAES